MVLNFTSLRFKIRVTEMIADEIACREWEVGRAAEIYYIAGGASDDWIYEATGAVSYTVGYCRLTSARRGNLGIIL